MKWKIESLDHGPALWPLLGPFLASRSVHRELGGPIVSAPGTRWWVAVQGADVLGFASLRPTRTATWHDVSYVVPEHRGKGVHSLLADERDSYAMEHHPGLPERVATCERRWHHYAERGWTVASERGSWVHGIRVLR